MPDEPTSESIEDSLPSNYIVARDDPTYLYTLVKHFKLTHYFSKDAKRVVPIDSEYFDKFKNDVSQFRFNTYYIKKHLFGDEWVIYMLRIIEEDLENSGFHMLLRCKEKDHEGFEVNMNTLFKQLSPNDY